MNELFRNPPVLGFAAYSGSGKTTLLTRLLPLLRERGLRIGMVKHAHHQFDIDHPGKDSYELRKAGAEQMLIASSRRWALMQENPSPLEPDLAELLRRLDRSRLDLILVEGFKDVAFPKIEIFRPSKGHSPLFQQDSAIIAVASDAPLSASRPVLNLNDPAEVADFIQAWMSDAAKAGTGDQSA